MYGMEHEHNHALTFTEGYADFYRNCPVCDEGMRLLADITKVRRLPLGTGAKYDPVTSPNLAYEVTEIPPEDFAFTTGGDGRITEAWVSEP